MDEIKLNDGKGLYDNLGLCDTMIVDCNNLEKHLVSGDYLIFMQTVLHMVQKLKNLKKGISAEIESKNKIIEELKSINDSLMEEKTGLPVDRSVDNGTD